MLPTHVYSMGILYTRNTVFYCYFFPLFLLCASSFSFWVSTSCLLIELNMCVCSNMMYMETNEGGEEEGAEHSQLCHAQVSPTHTHLLLSRLGFVRGRLLDEGSGRGGLGTVGEGEWGEHSEGATWRGGTTMCMIGGDPYLTQFVKHEQMNVELYCCVKPLHYSFVVFVVVFTLYNQ